LGERRPSGYPAVWWDRFFLKDRSIGQGSLGVSKSLVDASKMLINYCVVSKNIIAYGRLFELAPPSFDPDSA
jgi:hypothetical protein